jgi:IS1 family transposase
MPNLSRNDRLALRERQAEMNILPIEKQIQIVNALVEGCSVRATARMVGVEHKTVMRVLRRAGDHCARLLDLNRRGIRARFVQVDEIWTYCYVKERHMNGGHNHAEMGDQYVFCATDAETKLVPSFVIGKRDDSAAYLFMRDVQSQLAHRVQLTSDGFRPYLTAIEDSFGSEIDYAQLIKLFSGNEAERERYSPSDIAKVVPVLVSGKPQFQYISTSFADRQNLTMRMSMRRFTRLTNAFSKKLANLKAAVALYFAHYNFVRVHQTLRVTPAMAGGLTDRIWETAELIK